jgi:hypothetical protein
MLEGEAHRISCDAPIHSAAHLPPSPLPDPAATGFRRSS